MASWYDRHIVPRIIRYGCGCEMVRPYREAIVPLAGGRVLELGAGAGANFRYYRPDAVSEVIGIEPSAELRAYAETAPRAEGVRASVREASGEALPFDDASFDTVVTTYTLCSVIDAPGTLAEARRVLRPGGQLLFCEHGAAPDAGVAKWQRRIEPVWKRLFGGCHLTRPVGAGVAEHFSIDWIERGYAPKAPRIAGWMEHGRAVAS